MKKYIALAMLVTLGGSAIVAVRAASAEEPRGRSVTSGSAQIGELDSRLSKRIAEQEELIGIVRRLLQLNAEQKLEQAEKDRANALSGRAAPPPPPLPAASPIRKAAVAPPPAASEPVARPPWWLPYRVSMVYGSGDDRVAVVNGKVMRRGQSPDPEIVVDSITEDGVTLRKGAEVHSLPVKK